MSLAVKLVEVKLLDGRTVLIERIPGGIRIGPENKPAPVFTVAEAAEVAAALNLIVEAES